MEGVEEGGKRKGVVRLSAMGMGRISFKSMWTHVSGWQEPQQRPVRFVYSFCFFFSRIWRRSCSDLLWWRSWALSFARSFSHPAALPLPCNSCSDFPLFACLLFIHYLFIFISLYLFLFHCFFFVPLQFSRIHPLHSPTINPPPRFDPPPDFLLPTTPSPITSVAVSKPFLDLAETVGIVP
jgi:hypothetical protein